jgi:hypothetical protein
MPAPAPVAAATLAATPASIVRIDESEMAVRSGGESDEDDNNDD